MSQGDKIRAIAMGIERRQRVNKDDMPIVLAILKHYVYQLEAVSTELTEQEKRLKIEQFIKKDDSL